LCKSSRKYLHDSLRDDLHALNYCLLMSTKEESGRRIRAAREAKNLTLHGVANLVEGISPSRLSNWEHGTRMIGVDEAKKLAPALGTTAEYLLTLTDEKPDPQEVALLEFYRLCDERGKRATLSTAEKELAFISEQKTASEDGRRKQNIGHDPERRVGESDRRKVNLGFDPERKHFYPAPNFPHKPIQVVERRSKKNER
jgi:transcriptional regulator with XRE-family HTH domain